MLVPASATREQIEAFALANESVQKFVNGQKPKKVVVVPGRLVNVVV
jgi:leucyl-tRNA synthetase